MRTHVLETKRLPVVDYTRLVENPVKFRLKNFSDGGIRKFFQKLLNFLKISTRNMFLRVYKHFWVFEKFLKILDFGPFEGSALQGQKNFEGSKKIFQKIFLRVWKKIFEKLLTATSPPPSVLVSAVPYTTYHISTKHVLVCIIRS